MIEIVFRATIFFVPHDGILLCFGSQVSDSGSWEPLVLILSVSLISFLLGFCLPNNSVHISDTRSRRPIYFTSRCVLVVDHEALWIRSLWPTFYAWVTLVKFLYSTCRSRTQIPDQWYFTSRCVLDSRPWCNMNKVTTTYILRLIDIG